MNDMQQIELMLVLERIATALENIEVNLRLARAGQ
jgi:hypothetical protein